MHLKGKMRFKNSRGIKSLSKKQKEYTKEMKEKKTPPQELMPCDVLGMGSQHYIDNSWKELSESIWAEFERLQRSPEELKMVSAETKADATAFSLAGTDDGMEFFRELVKQSGGFNPSWTWVERGLSIRILFEIPGDLPNPDNKTIQKVEHLMNFEYSAVSAQELINKARELGIAFVKVTKERKIKEDKKKKERITRLKKEIRDLSNMPADLILAASKKLLGNL